MARKKSASKRAREAEEAQKREEQLKNAEPEVRNQIEEEFESEDDESSSEEEDDYGELITEDVEEGINQVLDAIKKGDKALFDPTKKFFGDSDKKQSTEIKEKHKPIYLKDYHRMNLLSGQALNDEEGDGDDDFKTYDEQKKEEREEILSEIKNAFNDIENDDDQSNNDDDGDNDDDFIVKKSKPSVAETAKRVLPDATKDEEKFLEEFTKQHAWIPHKGDKTIDLDGQGEDDEEFDDAVEKFEHAYNFRYEDPNSTEIISYARNQATVRRNELAGGRRKKRELEREEKAKEKEAKQQAIQKKKNEKINKLTDILEQVKKEYGAEIDEKLAKKISDSLLDKDFDDSQWDSLLGEIFNDQFYNDEIQKPTWDDDDEIMKDFKAGDDDNDDEASEDEVQDEEEDEVEDKGEEIEEEDDDEVNEPPAKKSKKEQIHEKSSKKKEKKKLKELAEKVVEQNKLKIIDQVEDEREGRSKERKDTFKYREVSPETFGLSTREIFLADDAQLNEFIGLKKLAPYRPKELRVKERRKLKKKRALEEWRKKVFKNKEGPKGDIDEISIPVNPKKHNDNPKKRKLTK